MYNFYFLNLADSMYGGLLQWCKGEFIVEAFKVFSDTSFKEAE